MDYKIQAINTTMLQTNTYMIFNNETKECIVVDIGDSSSEIYDYISSKGFKVVAILLTHLHFDHSNGVKELKELSNCKVYMPEEELNFINSPRNLAVGVGIKYNKFTPDVLLNGGEKLCIAGFNIEVLQTPGHTIGGTTYIFTDIDTMFVGDTIFKGTYGRVDLPTGNYTSMLESIEKLCSLDKNYRVLCGHGEETTLFEERINNGYSKNNN